MELLVAGSKASNVPGILQTKDLETIKCLRRRCSSHSGFIGIADVSNGEDRLRLRRILEDNFKYKGLMMIDDSSVTIIDTGCTRSSLHDKLDFENRTLKKME